MIKIVALLYLLALAVTAQAGCHRRLKSKRFRNIFPNGRIIGGEDTDITQIPYQVQLEEECEQFCGGSILSASYVMTSARCAGWGKTVGFQVRYGTSKRSEGGTIVEVAEISQHPNSHLFSLDFDVSVLRLETEIIFSDKAQPIALASVEPNAGEDALLSGWGTLADDEKPKQLQSIIIPVVDREECNNSYSGMVTERMICGGGTGKGFCQGDSGGPFVTNNVQSGIVSWAYGCAQEGFPGVYSNVAALRDFIDANSAYTARWV